jgi:ribose transport system permease protein
MDQQSKKIDDLMSTWARVFNGRSTNIAIFTVLLFLVSPIVAPGSLNSASVLSMIPFASVLAMIAVGQTLVVQQRGLDLSIPGMVALAAVFGTSLTQNYNAPVWVAVVAGILVPGAMGLVNGIFVSVFKVVPIIVTLGMNSVLIGFVFLFSKGTPSGASDGLNQFALEKTWGIPHTLMLALLLILIAGIVTQRTIVGRKLRNIGVSELASAILGHRVVGYKIMTYGFAGLCYGAAGVLLAGYIKTPNLFLGDSYLLPSVAAVVLGGSALTGGISSILASSIAALFLTQLGQILRSIGWPDATQYMAQAAVLIAVIVVRELTFLRKMKKKGKN